MRPQPRSAFAPPHQPVREITDHDLLTWELQFAKEGTLPPEVQRRLLEHLAERPVAVRP